MAFSTIGILVLALLAGVHGHPLASPHDAERRAGLLLSARDGSWSQPEGHPVHKLFARQANLTYPASNPDPNAMPDAWKQALQKIKDAGLIPNIPPSKEGVYPNGLNPNGPEICSSTAQCHGEGDIWDAPDGMLGVSFDDGPTTASPALYDFLKAQNQRATHFMIGVNIRDNKDIFMQTFNDGNDIAVHTWTHRYMTSLSDEEIVAEFGYTMQIISDFTGGRVARYWRPPYGDSDNRVRAIAKHIFNLIQVDWNHDTDDWELGTKQITPEKIASELKSFIALPKSPGLIILEHELYPGTVQAFIDAYPLMKSAGWDTRSIPQLYNTGFYQNAQDNTSPVTPQDIISGNPTANGTTPTTSASVSVSGSASSGNPSATQSGSPTMSGAALAASSAPAPSGSTSPKTNAGIASVAEVSKKALGAVFVLVVPLLLA